MEKYRQFTDEKTGINAFVPQWINNREAAPQMITRLLVTTILLPFRIALIVASAGLLLLGGKIQSSLGINNKSKTVSLFFNCVGAWLALFGLGYFGVGTHVADYKRLGVHAFSEPGKSICSQMKKKVIISNFTSVVDVLVFTAYLNSFFAIPHADGSISILTPLETITFALQFALLPNKGKYSSIADAVAKLPSLGAPLVTFPEAQKSCGACLLRWVVPASPEAQAADIELLKSGNVALATVGHPIGKAAKAFVFTAPHTTEASPLKYALKMMFGAIMHSADVSFVPAGEVKKVLSVKVKDQNAALETYVEQVATLMKKNLSVEWVHTTGAELDGFNKYWNKE